MAPRSVPQGTSKSDGKVYTWRDVAKHNKPDDAWVVYQNKVLKITDFLDRHPGGKEILLMCSGLDITNLFDSYHALMGDKPYKYLQSFEIGTIEEVETPRYKPDTEGFYSTMVTRVRNHLESKKINPRGAGEGTKFFLFHFLSLVFCYFVVMDVTFPGIGLSIRYLVAMLYGYFQTMICMHTVHDSSHLAIGGSSYSSFLGIFGMEWIVGASLISWTNQHIIGHHQVPNCFSADPDIPMKKDGDVRRIVSMQTLNSIYRFQWLYLPVAYCVLTMKSRLDDITDTIIKHVNGPVRTNPVRNLLGRMILPKLSFVIYRLVLPYYLFNIPLCHVIGLFLTSELVSGGWLAWNFEVSHLVPKALFPKLETASNSTNKKDHALSLKAIEQENINKSWAVAQVETACDYAHDSPLTTYFSAALNYQIEHHLFPGLSQYLYPEIAPIVKQTCKEFGVRYNYENTFWDAWKQHVKLLYDLGRMEVPYKWD